VPVPKEHRWKVGETRYEGFPLLLRFPDDINYDAPPAGFSTLLIITHNLAKVQPSGLPDKAYNTTLEDFDDSLIRLIESDGHGMLVLVETFGGKRAYYFYIDAVFDIHTVQVDVASRYSEHSLEWSTKPDEQWSFIKRYMKEFKFKPSHSKRS
jgi:hypothetical protein